MSSVIGVLTREAIFQDIDEIVTFYHHFAYLSRSFFFWLFTASIPHSFFTIAFASTATLHRSPLKQNETSLTRPPIFPLETGRGWGERHHKPCHDTRTCASPGALVPGYSKAVGRQREQGIRSGQVSRHRFSKVSGSLLRIL